MIAVIPVGRGRLNTLPYVVRSLARFAEVDHVVTVGNRPGIEPDLHIDSPNTDKAHINILGHLKRVTEQVEGEWIWCDDDTFTVRPWVPGVYVRTYSIAHHLRDFPNKGYYSKAVKASVELMESHGHDPEQVPCGPCHRPWRVNSERVGRVVSELEPVGGSFKTYYVAGLDGAIPVGDAKILGRGVPKPSADVVSVFNDSWKYNAGRIIRETFTEPSRWEPKPTQGTAGSADGRATARRRRHRR